MIKAMNIEGQKGSAALVIVLIIVLVAALAVAGIWYWTVRESGMNNFGPQNTAATATQTTSTSTGIGQVYSNKYMTVTIPPGWVIAPTSSNASAITITKGDYILFINTRTSQASGIQGGRFGEIAGPGASVNAVVTEQPAEPCGISTTSTIETNGVAATEIDFYDGPNNVTGPCVAPANGKTVWYFSYITLGDGYFNYFNSPEFVGWVITMSYNSSDINSLPVQGSADLNQALSQMDAILKTLTINLPTIYTPAVASQLTSAPDTDWVPTYSEGLNSEGVPTVSCTDDITAAANNTSTIDGAGVVASYSTESLAGNSNDVSTMYTTSNATSVFAGVEKILAAAGWSKCNYVTTTKQVDGRWFTNAIDVYRLNGELVDADLSSFLGVDGKVGWNIALTFYKMGQ
jgi:hypothetical protein